MSTEQPDYQSVWAGGQLDNKKEQADKKSGMPLKTNSNILYNKWGRHSTLFLWTLNSNIMDIEHYSQQFKTYLFRLGYADETIKHNGNEIKAFLSYLQAQKVKSLHQVQPEHIHAYNAYLHGLKSKLTGLGLNGKTIQVKINTIRLFSQYLEATEKLKIYSTTVEIIPSIKKYRDFLSQDEIKQLYNQTDDSIIGLRQRAILGLYYGCGLRYREGTRVELNHIDYKKELLYIIPSKNYHSRYVPINNRVLKDFSDYEKYARHHFKLHRNAFLSGSIGNEQLNEQIQNLCKQVKIEKRLSLHGLRHSIATHLLQQEMPIEQIAQFLGHRTIRATQIYTHIIETLKHEK